MISVYYEVMKRITVDLDDDIYRELKIKAAETGESMSDLVRLAILTHLHPAEGTDTS